MPEELKDVTTAVRRKERPFLLKDANGLAQEDMPVLFRFMDIEFADLLQYCSLVDPRFLGQFTQHPFFRLFTSFECTFDQLCAGLRMAEGENLPSITLLTQDDGTDFVDVVIHVCLKSLF